MHQFRTRLSTALAIIFAVLLSSATLSAQDGAKIFKGNCASCHRPTEAKLVGPGLKGVKSRWPEHDKLIAWVKNSQALVKSGDPHATQLFAEYNGSIMPAQALSDAEINAVIDWADKGGDAPATSSTEVSSKAPVSAGQGSQTYMYVLIAIAVLLIILISVLGTVQKSLQSLVNERQGIVVIEKPVLAPWPRFRNWASNNKKIVAILSLFLIIWLLKLGWNGLLGVGVYQGYAPAQPIKFSHKLHAGDNKIACAYCHVGVEKSKHANIPSANVCMNCHMYIQEGPTTGKEEISKIYGALDYNPETRKYGPNQKPIQWIGVHSLPDLAYFNHSQHVKVGKIECKECHGPVDSMEVVKQYAPLTMGWCIDCHRRTEVDYKDNNYYARLHEIFVKDPNYRKDEKFTIGKIGGLECSKCHY